MHNEFKWNNLVENQMEQWEIHWGWQIESEEITLLENLMSLRKNMTFSNRKKDDWVLTENRKMVKLGNFMIPSKWVCVVYGLFYLNLSDFPSITSMCPPFSFFPSSTGLSSGNWKDIKLNRKWMLSSLIEVSFITNLIILTNFNSLVQYMTQPLTTLWIERIANHQQKGQTFQKIGKTGLHMLLGNICYKSMDTHIFQWNRTAGK